MRFALLLLFAAATGARADDDLTLPSTQVCATPKATQLQQAETAWKAHQPAGQVARNVHGLRLNDSAKELGWLERSIDARPPDTFQRAVKASCTTVEYA